MAAVQKRDACPDTDRTLVLSGEIVIESREEKLVDSRLPFRIVSRLGGAERVCRERIGHPDEAGSKGIIRQNSSPVNELERFHARVCWAVARRVAATFEPRTRRDTSTQWP